MVPQPLRLFDRARPHFYLDVRPEELVHRVFQKNSILDYYESGMDIGLSDDMYKSFIIYQGKMAREFEKMKKIFGLQSSTGNGPSSRSTQTYRSASTVPEPPEMKPTQTAARQLARRFNQNVADPRHAPRGISKSGRLATTAALRRAAKGYELLFGPPERRSYGSSRKALRLSFEGSSPEQRARCETSTP